MQLSTVLILVLIVRPCLARNIIQTSNLDQRHELVQATVKVLRYCYGTQVNAVGLAGDSNGLLIKELEHSTSVSVSLLDSTGRVVSHHHVQRERPYKLQVFIVTSSSSSELTKIIREIKNSLWWNHMASIIILVWLPKSEDGCSKAFEMLSAAWKLNLLNTKLVCLHPTKEILIYTYNPYLTTAPNTWTMEKTYNGKNEHPWTLFKRKYEEGKQICTELDFDKTRNLGGYEIRVSVKTHPGFLTVDSNKTGLDGLKGNFSAIPKNLFRALNSTVKFLVYNQTGNSSFMVHKGRNSLMDVIEGISDMQLNQRYMELKDGIKTSCPTKFTTLGIITQYSGQMSQLSKILSVVDNTSERGICLVVLITLLFLIFVLRQSPVPAFLNTWRMICNGALLKLPLNLAPRIYLGSLFIFVVTIQAIYQGKLAALLTKPHPYPNIKTMQDLIDSHHTVYSGKNIQRYFTDPAFEGRYIKLENYSCIPYVLRDSSAACVAPYEFVIQDAAAVNLHLSQDDVAKLPVAYMIRYDWPLESRFNKILTTMIETFFIRYEDLRPYQKILDLREIREKQEKEQQFKNITFNDLSFAFVILAIGLSCAAVCFIAEIVTGSRNFRIRIALWKR